MPTDVIKPLKKYLIFGFQYLSKILVLLFSIDYEAYEINKKYNHAIRDYIQIYLVM
jgi:hypothetical protein